MTIKTVIAVLAVLAILEGLFAVIAPKQIEKMLKFFSKKKTGYFKKIGLIEIIIAIIVLVIVYYV